MGEPCTNVVKNTLKLGKVLRNSIYIWFGTAFRKFNNIICFTERNSELCSLPRNGSERNSENLHLYGFTERNSELCSLQQKGSERNNGNLLLFLFHGTVFRVVFSSAEGFGTEFRDFLFPTLYVIRARICKPFMELRNRFPVWRFSKTTLFVVPARQATLAGGID